MKEQKIYIAGPISNMPKLNKPLFDSTAKSLRDLGFTVINPHELCSDISPDDWISCMKVCIAAMMDCNKLLLLEGWQQSQGACVEFQLAFKLGMEPENIEMFMKSYQPC